MTQNAGTFARHINKISACKSIFTRGGGKHVQGAQLRGPCCYKMQNVTYMTNHPIEIYPFYLQKTLCLQKKSKR